MASPEPLATRGANFSPASESNQVPPTAFRVEVDQPAELSNDSRPSASGLITVRSSPLVIHPFPSLTSS